MQNEAQRKLSRLLARKRMLKRLKQQAKEHRATQPKARRLKVIAAWLNAHVPALVAEIVEGYDSGDRQMGRLRSPGKGRYGTRLIVKDRASGEVVKDHNSAEAYRTNNDVEQWIKHEVLNQYKVV